MTERIKPTRRDRYAHCSVMPTRWADNDVYGHVNNVVYYAFFDTAVNRHLIDHGVLDVERSPVIGLVVETRCTYFSSVAFPDTLTVGLRVAQLGTRSVRYEIAIFRNDDEEASALGEFVHVYVDRQTNRSVPIPPAVRGVLEQLMR